MNPAETDTIVSLFWQRVQRSGQQPALISKHQGSWQTRSWNELASDVLRMARILHEHGVRAGDRVVQISENRWEWIVADLAILGLGAVHVPIHPTLSGRQMAHQIEHCGAHVICLSGAAVAEQLTSARAALPSGLQWIVYDPQVRDMAGQSVCQLHELLPHAAPHAVPEVDQVRPQSLATILYTSGTTGEPKGVMLSHGNLSSNTHGVLRAMAHRDTDVRLGFLPLSHIFARTCDVYTWIAAGCQLGQAESRTSVLDDCQIVRPTVLNGVPYFFERLVKILQQRCDDSAPALRQLLGGRIEYCCSGGAPLPEHLYDFFAQRGVPLLQGYGLTETSPVITASTLAANRRGAVGRPLPDIEVRIAEDGEILTRGSHVMLGYFRDSVATHEIIRDGWLQTGDIGRLDDDGFLYITGRKKELIVTSAGKNIAPSCIEALLAEDPLVHQVLVVGDRRPFLGALIVPDPEGLRAAIEQCGISVGSADQVLAHPQVRQLYQQRITQRLACLSHHEQVRSFCLVGRAFTLEHDEMTAKLSLRREVIQQHFAREIEQLYCSDSERPHMSLGHQENVQA